MDEVTMQGNLNTLKEMILDEQKLVTYVSLSKDLCVHVNDSKKLLTKFVDSIRKERPNLELNVTYMISGLSEDNKARTRVASENEMDAIKKSLKVVFFQHIYSVSKGLPCVDNIALLAISKFEDFSLCTGLIKSSFCIKRSSDEMSDLKSNSQVFIQNEQKPSNFFKKVKEVNASNIHEDTKSVTKMHETKSEPSMKTEIQSPKKESSNATNPKADNKKNGKTQRGITGFFAKSNSAPSKVFSKDSAEHKQEVTIKKEKDTIKEIPKVKEAEMDVDVEEAVSQRETSKTESKSEVKKEQVNCKPKNKLNEKLNKIKKNAKVDKKRKRVLHVSDSESEDEKDPFVDDEPQEHNMSDDEIPPTPTVNTVKITSGIVNPKKRRKIVDKTYTDEDGYILTKKEEVYDSCSDDEEVVSVKENIIAPPVNQVKQETSPKGKKNGLKNSKKKISPPQKGKQATLMNFFKKV